MWCRSERPGAEVFGEERAGQMQASTGPERSVAEQFYDFAM